MGPPTRRVLAAVLVATVTWAAVACSSDEEPEAVEPDLERFCELVTRAAPLSEALGALDVDAARDHADVLGRAVEVAPVTVADDVATVHAFVEDVLAGMDQADPLTTETAAAVLDGLAERQEAMEAAGVRMETFTVEQCGVDLNSVNVSAP